MDQNGNLTLNEKEKLAEFLLELKHWFQSTNESIDTTLELVDNFEKFRKSLED